MAFGYQCCTLLVQIPSNTIPVYFVAEELVTGRFHFIFSSIIFLNLKSQRIELNEASSFVIIKGY